MDKAIKTNIRSFRFSDEIYEIIEKQAGESFSAKLEQLIYTAYMLVPEMEKKAAALDAQVKQAQKDLSGLQRKHQKISSQLNDCNLYADRLLKALKTATEDISAV